MAHLFTIICEYKGGTYTQQVHGENPVEAFAQWAEGFVKEDVLSAPEKKISPVKCSIRWPKEIW